MQISLNNKVAIVTGATSGIGRASAIALAESGAKVVFAARNGDRGSQVAAEIKEKGGTAIFVKADVTVPSDVEALINTALETYGRLDIAVNNAGAEGQIAPTTECTVDNFNMVLASNATSVWLCMKYEIPVMKRQGGGVIVNTASALGLKAIANMPAYVAAKHAVIGLTKAAALEHARDQIRVNAIAPGSTDTAMIGRFTGGNPDAIKYLANLAPMGRLGRPEEVAAGIVWMASDLASYVTGAVLSIDGGLVMA